MLAAYSMDKLFGINNVDLNEVVTLPPNLA